MPALKPDLLRVTMKQLSELCGRKPQTIRRLLDGLAPIEVRNRTQLYESREALSRIYGAAGHDLSAEKGALTRAQREGQEMRNARERGELVPADQVEGALVALLSGVRQRLLAVPAKAATEAHVAESLAEVEASIRRHIAEALEELTDAA